MTGARAATAAATMLALLLLGRSAGIGAHDFFEPDVTVSVTEVAPGAHPDLQTVISQPEGAQFDEVVVKSPPGSSIAADADVPDGTVVGRLDAETTTNALTGPDCNVRVTFTVPLVEATTDTASPHYPAYLSELAPGQHRLRIVADVSPSPEIPVLINTLFDIEEGQVVSHTFVGDPRNPPLPLVSCTPGRSVNTFFGLLPDGTPLLTSPDPLPDDPLPFEYTFTSRADDDGERHEHSLEVLATAPSAPSKAPGDFLVRLFGFSGQLEWTYDSLPESFLVTMTVAEPAGGPQRVETFTVSGGRHEFFFPNELVPQGCNRTVTYAVAAVGAGITGPPAISETFGGCVDGPENPSPFAPPDDLHLEVERDGSVTLVWRDQVHTLFDVQLVHPSDTDVSSLTDVHDVQGFRLRLPRDVVPDCDTARRFSFRVIAQDPEHDNPTGTLVGASDEFRCIPAGRIGAPDAGSGPPPRTASAWLIALAVGGLVIASAGLGLLRRRLR